MNNSNFNLSMNDSAELRKLIVENPDLPLLCFAGEGANTGEYPCELTDIHGCAIKKLTLYNDYWLDEDDYAERLADDLNDMDEYAYLSDGEFYALVDEKVKNAEYVEAIVFYVG